MKKLVTILCLMLLSLNAYGECVNSGYEKYNKKGMIKGAPAQGGEPAVGVGYLHIKDIAEIFTNGKASDYIFVDTRPARLFKECTIKGAKNIPFKFSGAGKLTKDFVDSSNKAGKKMVYFCNSIKCYRSLNAAIESKCKMGATDGSVFWYGRGTAGIASSPHAKNILAGTKCDTLRILLNGKAKK